MALEQLFTLAFALHLEPLPTLDYAAVPVQNSASEHNDGDNDPASLRVGGNTRLEPVYDRHLPHSIDTLSFVLNYTQAMDAIEPFAELISMLDKADDSPDFRNLREFFDTRYHPDGQLVGSTKEQTPTSRRVFRSTSRAASINPPHRRGSQTTEGRKLSFATSIGNASGLKMGWRRKNTDTQQTQDVSDDEDSHSRMSSSGHINLPAPSSAPYIHLLKAPSTQTAHTTKSPDLAQDSPRPAHATEYRRTKLVNFTVRLDLHTVGLAPAPPKPRVYRNQDSAALKRVGSAKSTSSSEWRRRRQHSHMSGGAALYPVRSPDSIASFGLTSPELESHSDFSRLYEEMAAADASHAKSAAIPSDSDPALHSTDTPLSSIDEGTALRDSQLNRVVSGVSSTGITSSKPSRRPSMMSRLLDLGRKKSVSDHSDTVDHQQAGALPMHESSTTRSRPPSSGRQSSFRSGLKRDMSQSSKGAHEEALDLEEEDEDVEEDKVTSRRTKGLFGRRRSSVESANKHAVASARSMEPDLRSVQENGMLDLHRPTSRSSVDTSLSGLGPDDVVGTSASADGADGFVTRARSDTVEEGRDFVTLLRRAATLCLNSTEDRYTLPNENTDANGSDATTTNEGRSHDGPRESLDSPSLRTPRVYPKKSSVPSTPGKSVKSLDLDRSPAMSNHSNPIDAHFKLGASLAEKRGAEAEAWWPCGDVDPLPVSISSALGQALGWEGIMHLCYGVGSRAANQGDYVALGKAAVMDEANKVQEKSVLAWRTGVVSSGTSPDKYAQTESLGDVGSSEVQRLGDSLSDGMQLNNAPTSYMEKMLAKSGEWQASSSLFGAKVNTLRTWKHWQMLMKSIKGWVDEYESVRVRHGLAREMGLDPLVDDASMNGSQLSPDADHGSSSVQVPFSVGSPQLNQVAVFQAPSGQVDAQMMSKVQSASRTIPHCILADATNRQHGFRRRAGIPEGLPLGPEDEESIDYSWSRQKLSVQHFGTAMTISADSFSHYVSQLCAAEWVHRSAWELDYLEMCVFKTPLVAERFVPPGEAAVPSTRSYHPQAGTVDRSKLCPNPDERGAWDPDTWKRWLSSLREGEIIVPAISWQAWWTLISVLNGADRSGRSYDLQVKTAEEPFEALTDLSAVYL